MEPVEAERIKINIAYVVYAKVLKIEWRNHPGGYFVHFEGSWESINFGLEPPQFSTDDTVKITFQKVESNALSIQTSI